jgi:hypothetical protein
MSAMRITVWYHRSEPFVVLHETDDVVLLCGGYEFVVV